jgi:hypothetical protein
MDEKILLYLSYNIFMMVSYNVYGRRERERERERETSPQ